MSTASFDKQLDRNGIFILTAFFFFSGFSALIYEIIWIRIFSDILGSTAIAMTLVISAFLLLLALGAYLFGRYPMRGISALALYGWIEIGIGISALIISALLFYMRSHYIFPIPASQIYPVSLMYKFIITFLIMGIPALLMGGTFPVILSASSQWASPRHTTAKLYGWNIIGSACGCFAAGYVFIWKFGLSFTIGIAITINILIGLLSLILLRQIPYKVKNDNSIDDLNINNEQTGKSNFPVWGGLAFFSGFCVLSYEILWGRMAKFLLGDRTIAITTLLFVFILSLGFGSLASDRLSRYYGFKTTKQVVKLLLWIFLISSLLHLAIIPLTLKTISGQGLYQILPFDNIFIRRVIIIWILIFPPITFLGIAFPYLLQSAKDLDKMPGKITGKLYLINTFGAVLGAIFINWVCIRWIGTIGGFVLIIGLMVVFSSIAIMLTDVSVRGIITVIMALVIFTVSALNYKYKVVFLKKDEILIAENEDEYGIQSLVRTERNYLSARNNRIQLIYDLGHWQTSHAQQMAAYLPVLFAADYEQVLNIGTGYGITAGAFTLYPEIKSIETIEILPFLVQNQNKFKDYNFSYFKDPRVSLIQGDGRNHLFKSQKKYDIITVNVLDPYLPGSSSLYTVDFWKLARQRLRPGGVFTQLLWGNDVPLLVKGLNKVFPTVLYFPAYGGTAYNIVAFTGPVNKSGLNLHLERLGLEVLTNISKFTNVKPQQYFRQLTKGSWTISKILEVSANKIKGRCHTDNFPILEYRWTHGVKGASIFDSPSTEQ